MFDWYKRRRVKSIINKYNEADKVRDLILSLFGRNNSESDCDLTIENELLRVDYSSSNDGDNREYKVFTRQNDNYILVFHRIVNVDNVSVKKFVMGYWIYQLYEMKDGDVDLKDVYFPGVIFPSVEKETSRLLNVE